MGIYIDIEMPKDGLKNIMILADGRVFQFSGYGNPKPLGTAVSVPPHGRLIDADALPWFLANTSVKYETYEDWEMLCDAIATAPTIIPASEEE